MAILMIHDVSDGRLAEYDRVIKALEAAGQGNPPGRLSHVAARKGDGYLVVDVWESQEAFDRFGQTLVPLLEQAGGRVPTPQIHPVHNVIKGA
ncbi:MAG: hypothetical protein H0V51_24615 [Chloroflexi bacterium]|nr:hypothetical protein [Chloroflexota bacterium]